MQDSYARPTGNRRIDSCGGTCPLRSNPSQQSRSRKCTRAQRVRERGAACAKPTSTFISDAENVEMKDKNKNVSALARRTRWRFLKLAPPGIQTNVLLALNLNGIAGTFPAHVDPTARLAELWRRCPTQPGGIQSPAGTLANIYQHAGVLRRPHTFFRPPT